MKPEPPSATGDLVCERGAGDRDDLEPGRGDQVAAIPDRDDCGGEQSRGRAADDPVADLPTTIVTAW